ncbi:MAG: hypothetical protein ACRCSN_17125 [Dermatophilaceae bacterium]
MKNTNTPGRLGLTLRWVPVDLADGRIRMEMRWVGPQAVGRQNAA